MIWLSIICIIISIPKRYSMYIPWIHLHSIASKPRKGAARQLWPTAALRISAPDNSGTVTLQIQRENMREHLRTLRLHFSLFQNVRTSKHHTTCISHAQLMNTSNSQSSPSPEMFAFASGQLGPALPKRLRSTPLALHEPRTTMAKTRFRMISDDFGLNARGASTIWITAAAASKARDAPPGPQMAKCICFWPTFNATDIISDNNFHRFFYL